MAPFAVYADDFKYIPIDDIEQYNAYKFWSLYGYKLDYTNTISYTSISSGTITYEGTLTSSLNGIENGSIGISLSGTLSSANGEGGTLSTFNQSFDADGLKMTILASRDGNIETISYGCVFSNPNTSVGAYSNATCTPTDNLAGFDAPDYDIEIQQDTNGSAEFVSIGQLFITLVNRTTGQGSYSGSISISQSGTQSGTGTINISGTSSTTGHKTYDIPMITNEGIDNTLTGRKVFRARNDNPFVVAFLDDKSTYVGNYINVYLSSDTEGQNDYTSTLYHRINEINIGGYFLHTFELYNINNNNDYYYMNLTGNRWNSAMIPLYVGYKNNMSDKLYRYLYGSDRSNEILENGNSNSQGQILVNDNTTNQFNYVSNNMHDIENTWENNLDAKLTDINTDSEILSNNKFLSSANWVRTQFERIVLNTPFELLLVFSLILGIALVLIGKVR